LRELPWKGKVFLSTGKMELFFGFVFKMTEYAVWVLSASKLLCYHSIVKEQNRNMEVFLS
jgi:hypothetical protein